MKIEFECIGGYADLRLHLKKRAIEFSSNTEAELRKLIAKSSFFNIDPSTLHPEGPRYPDMYTYKLSVKDGSSKQTVICDDKSAPENLCELLEFLQILALYGDRNPCVIKRMQ